MRNSISFISHEDKSGLISQPDSYIDNVQKRTRIIETVNDAEQIYCLDELGGIDDIHITKIVVISANNYLDVGIRACLEKRKNIRLKVMKNLYKKPLAGWIEEYNIIILCECESYNAGRILSFITSLRKHNRRVKIIVVSEASNVLFEKLANIWIGIWHIYRRTSLESFEDVLKNILKRTKITGPQLKSLFTPRQWQTLKLLSQGYSLTKAAYFMGISIKTTSMHKKLALDRIGVSNNIQQAWIVEAIATSYTKSTRR